jgi:eukaryotic-like serine/threonine-protein kinase
VPVRPGVKLGAYEVKELIGQGAMGSVYLARHEALDRTAAVKVMRALEDDPAAAARFRREGQAIALLRHTNIVTVYDYGEYDGVPYMIVEYVPGGSLAGRLRAAGRLPKPTVVRMLRQIAAGLDYAHEMGVVHRDVKPANVLMGRDDMPVLADFGLAKVEQQARMTAYGMATGTPAYMAPEQISDGEVGPPADVYALATVAYEMLTGHLPYETDGVSVMTLLVTKMRDDPPPPSQYDATLNEKVDRIILRGLAREPGARWKSCGAMVEALAGVLEPQADLAATATMTPLTFVDRLRALDWQRWAWASLPVAAIAALLIVFVLVPRLRYQPAAQASPTPGGPGIVACPDVSPSPPKVSASPNPAPAGTPVTYSASGFQPGVPFFVIVDSTGDCTNPTSGAIVYSTSGYTDPLHSDPSPLPDSLTPGDYQLRACNHNPGQNPTNCVQVPFTVTEAPSASPATSERSSPSPG